MIFQIFTLLATFFTLATSLPTLDEPCAIDPDKPQDVYPCESKNFTGKCVWKPSGVCITDTSEVRSRSIGPDPGTYCELFWEEDCKGKPVQFNVYNEPKPKGLFA